MRGLKSYLEKGEGMEGEEIMVIMIMEEIWENLLFKGDNLRIV